MSLYAEKYTTSPDIILATDDNAVDFLLTHRDTLFPGVPVVFSGLNTAKKEHRVQVEGFTGLTESVDVKRTLDLIIKLHPDVKQVIAIADATIGSQVRLQHYRDVASEIAKHTPHVTFSDFANWTFSELIEQLKTLTIPHRFALSLSQPRSQWGLAATGGQFDGPHQQQYRSDLHPMAKSWHWRWCHWWLCG